MYFNNNISFVKNYWNRPRIFPKIIFGLLVGQPNPVIPWIIFDWFPSNKINEQA